MKFLLAFAFALLVTLSSAQAPERKRRESLLISQMYGEEKVRGQSLFEEAHRSLMSMSMSMSMPPPPAPKEPKEPKGMKRVRARA